MEEVICVSCLNIKEPMDYNKLTFYDIDQAPIKIVGFDEYYYCVKCEESLEPEDWYIKEEDEEEIYIKVGEVLGTNLSSYIEYCSSCKGEEIEHTEYVMGKEFGHVESSGTDMIDFLGEHAVYNEELMKLVLNNLTCQHCGYGTYDRKENNKFQALDKIYSSRDLDEFYGLDFSELNVLAHKYNINFMKEDLTAFIEFIFGNPSLAMKHQTGQKLYDLLSNHYESENYYTIQEGKILYRGRKRYLDQKKLAEEELWSPPDGKATHGRYNPIGKSVFYCTDNREGLPYELNPLKNECIDYGEFLTLKYLKILDVSEIFPEEFGEYIAATNVESNLLKKGYLLTNFISNCCEEIGYDGICYKGINDNVNYNNYALFNIEPNTNLAIEGTKSIGTNIKYNIFDNIFS